MISRIPNHDFVFCKDCVHNKARKIFKPQKKRPSMKAHCHLVKPPVLLRGRRGCTKGKVRS